MVKKLALIFAALGFVSAVWAAPVENRTFTGSGEVINVSPLNNRLTIKHGIIPNFSESNQTEFAVSSKDLLVKISGGDLVEFTITETKGNAEITKIERTGVAVKEETHIGQAIQQTLEGAGQAATTIASPIAPAGQAVGAVTGATTDVTGTVLNNADPQIKKDF